MEKHGEIAEPLSILPSVDFCCAYGSSLLSNNKYKNSMVDYILGVSDPLQWHSENLEKNTGHYASWMAFLGPKMVTKVADNIGVGVHFNPFVIWKDKKIKYGVIRMHDLVQDLLCWERFYVAGRLQKPVQILVDNLGVENLNAINLNGALSVALLLLPSKFTEEELYAKICSLSYTGDLRMLFAEDRNKVQTIVKGKFKTFQRMYLPFLEEHARQDLLNFAPAGDQCVIQQDNGLSAACKLVSSIPASFKEKMGKEFGETKGASDSGQVISQVALSSREDAAKCVKKILKHRVMVSSARQAVSGVLATGGINAARYLAGKMFKAWKSLK